MNIFAGNLACTTTTQDLRQLFERYNSVDSIPVMTDHRGGMTCDGQTCGLTDVRVGDMVTMTTDTQNGKSVATKIAARQADSEAARPDAVSVGCRPVSLLPHRHGSRAARR